MPGPPSPTAQPCAVAIAAEDSPSLIDYGAPGFRGTRASHRFNFRASHADHDFNLLLDSGASIEGIVGNLTARRLGLLGRAKTAVPGEEKTLVGAYTGTLKKYVCVANIQVEGPDGPATLPAAHRVWIAPGELPAGIDMILGDPYLAMNQAVLDYGSMECTLRGPLSFKDRLKFERRGKEPPRRRVVLSGHRFEDAWEQDALSDYESFQRFCATESKAATGDFHVLAIHCVATLVADLKHIVGNKRAYATAMAMSTSEASGSDGTPGIVPLHV